MKTIADFLKRRRQLSHASLTDLLEADRAIQMEDDELDDRLWAVVSHACSDVARREHLPEPIRMYYAGRLIEWEVGNGGFAQAAFNVPDLLGDAAKAYELLSLPEAAQRVRKAQKIVERGRSGLVRSIGLTIAEVFAQFRKSPLAKLDEGLDEIGWWAVRPRMAYVRTHREVFISLQPQRTDA
jgi:hypothetical protein